MLRALQYTKLDRVMLFTQQKLGSECDVTLERYRTYIHTYMHACMHAQFTVNIIFKICNFTQTIWNFIILVLNQTVRT